MSIILTDVNAKEICDAINDAWYSQFCFLNNTTITRALEFRVAILEKMADGICGFYVGLFEDGYTVSESYVKAEADAKQLFEVERSIGFSLYELSV